MTNKRNLIPGGKSLTEGSQHSPVLNLRLPADVKSRLCRLAEAEGVGTSKYVRRVIEQHLAELEGD